MNEITKVVAPTSNVNDTSVVIYEFLVDNNSEVKAGQPVISVETSKATTNIESPVSGIIRFIVAVGDEVPNGGALAIVADTIEQLESFTLNTESIASVQGNSKEQILDSAQSEENKFITFGVFDHAVTLGEIMVKSGESVEKGAILCKVRDGNNIETVQAPRAGYISWNKNTYETNAAGEPLGRISHLRMIAPFESVDLSKDNLKYDSLRVSKAAKQLLDKNGLTAQALGLTGLVTVNEVMDFLNPNKNKKVDNPSEFVQPIVDTAFSYSTNGIYKKLSKAKRNEANFLSAANREAVVSQATVLVPTCGIISACNEDSELAKRFSSIIIFETSKLLKSYRNMNSIYEDGQLFVYDEINVGYAIAINDGLKVPVFKNSDQKELNVLIEEKDRFIEKYITKELSPDDLSGGTFTITDLSSTGCYMFNPVLNLGQSAILGIGGENPSHTDYPLILAYDHRVVDGAMAVEFLCKLRERLIAHENVLIGRPEKKEDVEIAPQQATAKELVCDSCFRTAEEVDKMGLFLFKVIDKTGKEKHICTICMKGW